MRSPASLGLPSRFSEWRDNQLDATLTVAASGDGFDGLNAPTGSGKTVIYMSAAALQGGRTIVLTSTKSLQDQLEREFPNSTDIRGQSNYECEIEKPRKVGVDEAICHFGVQCHLKGGGCTYFDAYRAAVGAHTVVTNYSYWMSVHEYSQGLGGFDFMVCDEAHEALNELGNYMSVRITDWERDAFLGKTAPGSESKLDWELWAKSMLIKMEPILNRETEELRRHPTNRSMLRRVHELRRSVKKLNGVVEAATSSHRWVHEEDRGSLVWTPVWPGRGSWAMFRGIRKVALVSATLTPKGLDLLGLSGYRYHEYPSTFAVANRPVYHISTGVRLRHDTDRHGLKAWLDKMDQIIQFRLDRKGIIHTVSYARRDYILNNSRFRGYMITHDRRNTRAKIAEFKKVKAPAILVSPSVDTGVDFPYQQCEYNIISKIPFPDSRSPVYAARHKDDADYGKHVAMVTLVQAAGRGCRAKDDRCETFIMDDSAEWFVRRNRKFAPKWFMDAYHPEMRVVPKPLAKLYERPGY